MRYLLGYSCYENEFSIHEWVGQWVGNLIKAGIDVRPFCLTINPPAPCLLWRELDERWRRKDRDLMKLYSELEEALSDRDVLVNWNGINLHPEFVQSLKVFSVYGCFDDPESSEVLSKPVAGSYDLCMVGNAAEVETYRSWGVKNVKFWPLGYRHNDVDLTLSKEQILSGTRDNEIMLCCERVSQHRKERLDKFSASFPQGAYYGRGWPNGFLAESDRVPLMLKTKIGINIHNSTGPINFRSYYLPANGVLQVCDNKKHLGMLYEIGKEVVGYDSIEEAIDLCRYYLEHEDERRVIAAAGFERATRDYNEVAVFKKLMREVERHNKTMDSSIQEIFNKHVAIIQSAVPERKIRLAEQSAEELVRVAPKELITYFTLMDIRSDLCDIDGVRQVYMSIPTELRSTALYHEKISIYEEWLKTALKEAWAPNALPLSADRIKLKDPSAYSLLMESYGNEKVNCIRAEAFLDPALKIFVLDNLEEVKTYFKLKLNERNGSNSPTNGRVSTASPNSAAALKLFHEFGFSEGNQLLTIIDAKKDMQTVYESTIESWNKLNGGGYLIWENFSPFIRSQSEIVNETMMGAAAFLLLKQMDQVVIHLKNSDLGIIKKPLE